jgi:hypothetical protein
MLEFLLGDENIQQRVLVSLLVNCADVGEKGFRWENTCLEDSD